MKVTADQFATLAAQGRYWYMRRDGSLYATDQFAADSADVFLLDASPAWVSQWENWDQAIAEMSAAGLFEQLERYLDSTA